MRAKGGYWRKIAKNIERKHNERGIETVKNILKRGSAGGTVHIADGRSFSGRRKKLCEAV